jgi:hypothetical protein
MTANRSSMALLSWTLALALIAGVARVASARNGSAEASGSVLEENARVALAAGDQDRAQDRTLDQTRERIQERIRTAQDLSAGERASMEANLGACLRAGVTDAELETVFPGSTRGKSISTRTMLELQARVRALAQDGLPVEPVLAKVREAQMKGVPEAGLAQVGERVEKQVREAKRIVAQAKADGIQPASDARHERQQIRELAQQMWRGTSPEDVDELRARMHERARSRSCSVEDLVAASETATRLREEGVEARRAMRVTGEALRRGYGAGEMRRLQYMMVYRHREGRAIKGLADDFEHCLDAGMDSGRMYQFMMQHGWMGPGDVQGPGGSSPIDDQGRGRGTPGGGPGGRGTGSSGPGDGNQIGAGGPQAGR